MQKLMITKNKKLPESIDSKFEKDFRAAYSKLYSSEKEIKAAMLSFNQEHHRIPDVSDKEYRRKFVEKKLSEKIPTAPYRTGESFTFEDISYFLGDCPLDLMFYGSMNINNLIFRKKSDLARLVKNGLDNSNIKVGNIILAYWDDEKDSDESIVKIKEYFAATDIKALTSGSTGKALQKPCEQQQSYEGPLLIIENKISWGVKHKEMLNLLTLNGLGIDYKNLVFNFVGEIEMNPDMCLAPSWINVLKLI